MKKYAVCRMYATKETKIKEVIQVFNSKDDALIAMRVFEYNVKHKKGYGRLEIFDTMYILNIM